MKIHHQDTKTPRVKAGRRPTPRARSLGVLCALVVNSLPAAAQIACLPRAEIAAALLAEFGERPAVLGLMASGSLLELFVAPAGATWTVIVIRPGGAACMIASGTGLMPVIEAPPAAAGRAP